MQVIPKLLQLPGKPVEIDYCDKPLKTWIKILLDNSFFMAKHYGLNGTLLTGQYTI